MLDREMTKFGSDSFRVSYVRVQKFPSTKFQNLSFLENYDNTNKKFPSRTARTIVIERGIAEKTRPQPCEQEVHVKCIEIYVKQLTSFACRKGTGGSEFLIYETKQGDTHDTRMAP